MSEDKELEEKSIDFQIDFDSSKSCSSFISSKSKLCRFDVPNFFGHRTKIQLRIRMAIQKVEVVYKEGNSRLKSVCLKFPTCLNMF